VLRRWLLDRYMCICVCVVHFRCCSFAVIFHHPCVFPLLLQIAFGVEAQFLLLRPPAIDTVQAIPLVSLSAFF
jgi:hypothetical protein